MITKEQIEAEAKQLLETRFSQQCFVQGALWFQSQQRGMRWVRASEKPIPNNERVYVKSQGMMGTGIFTNGVLYATNVIKNGSFYNLTASDLSTVEWLDESGDHTSELEKLRGENKEMLEMLKEIHVKFQSFFYSPPSQQRSMSYDIKERADSLITKIESNGK